MPSSIPQLTGEVHVAADADRLFDDLAHALMGAAIQAVSDREVFHLALSGGSTPEPFYMRLVTDPRFRAIPWERTHLWVVDERRVSEEDEKCNYRMIRETLADHVPMRRRQCHPMPVMLADADALYEQELRETLLGEPASAGGSESGSEGERRTSNIEHRTSNPIPRLDFVLLGMGDDAHTASLFPHSAALHETNRLIAINDGEHVTPPPRVTMTYPLLNAARHLAVLVVGGKKADTIRRVEQQLALGGPDPATLPITGIDPESAAGGSLVWYLDAAAAGR